MKAFAALNLAQLEPPTAVTVVDFEAHWEALKTLINGQFPLMLDENLQPVFDSPEWVATENGNFWSYAADSHEGRYALNLPVDPVPRALMVKAYLDILAQQQLNELVLAVLPAYATGANLDHVALRYGVQRLVVTPATDDADAVYEDDESLRRRMLISPEGDSAGGSEGWYLSHVLSADSRVKDAVVTSPNPTEILITVLSTEGNGTASAELLGIVETAVNEQYTRVLGDLITVQSAEIIEFSLDATLTYYPVTAHDVILQTIDTEWAKFRSDSEKIGHSITRSAVDSVLHQQGVFNVDIATVLPVDIGALQAPFCTALNLTDGGDNV